MAPLTGHTFWWSVPRLCSFRYCSRSFSDAARTAFASAINFWHSSTSPASPASSLARILASTRVCQPTLRSATLSSTRRACASSCSRALRTRSSHRLMRKPRRKKVSLSHPSRSFSVCGRASYSALHASSHTMREFLAGSIPTCLANSSRYPMFFLLPWKSWYGEQPTKKCRSTSSSSNLRRFPVTLSRSMLRSGPIISSSMAAKSDAMAIDAVAPSRPGI